MKAVRFEQHGGPEVLQYADAPEPSLGPTDVLVRVQACALNHLDLWVRQGLPGVKIPLPHIPGSDIAGEVAEVGSHVTRVKAGDKVVLCPGVSCNVCDICAAGLDNECHKYTLLGYMLEGGCAEYVAAPEVNAFPLPGGLSFEEAAAVPLVFLTAWHMLLGRAGLKAGEDVLVWGAGSGVGSAAIQIAKLHGARVITTVGSDAKLEKAKELGADEVVNHNSEDVVERVKAFTSKRGANIVFEHVGEASWERSLKCLARSGRLVICGATTGPKAGFDIRRLFSSHWTILGSYMGTRSELAKVLKLVNDGKLRPIVDRVFPLAEASAAHKYLEDREQFGKVVLKV